MRPHHEHDGLAALDFCGAAAESDEHGGAQSDALDFSVPHDDAEDSPVDALDACLPAEPRDTKNELDAIDSATQASEEPDTHSHDEEGLQLFTVANPSDAVRVSALIDGRTHRVQLSPKVTNMTESELAAQIVALAELARQTGLAGQRTYLLHNAPLAQTLRDMGLDANTALRDITDNGLGLPTPAQAAEAHSEVFATRYATDHD